ncbi:hypothetical protein KO528_10550 [Saccharophagus degradans]|uniref:hypothetical protein n=1 Tax=Saccharophagus degradans TaxID=86304 RepID=UPI001C09BA3B|nr:hypothetical protein [Saccharophagus degradans]MBU2985790.1 hypothetical protein [Saccharophagus degradans]WGP00375.1 hypothetical protein QFX18_09980 [Saccharophagus degradans]
MTNGLILGLLSVVLLLSFIYIADQYIFSVRIRSQLSGGAFQGMSYAMQASYFVRIGIFFYNGAVGLLIDYERNSVFFLFVVAVFANVTFFVFSMFERTWRSEKVLHESYADNMPKVLSAFDRSVLYFAQFMFQMAWLSPLIVNNFDDAMKGTAIAVGSLVNGVSGFVNAFRLEPLLRKFGEDKAQLYAFYVDVRNIKTRTAVISISVAFCVAAYNAWVSG